MTNTGVMLNNQLKAVELFAGIGCFRLGMANANIETIWANDFNKLSCQVYESNFGKGATPIADLYGITDGKKVGTYVEVVFNQYLALKYLYTLGNAASGIDFPELEVDLKVTSIKQPQSSCPYRSASQKVYGLGYNLLVFAYEKSDEHQSRTTHLNFQHVVFVAREQTGDY